ncbi:MAG: hypothetical protein JO078_03070 [Candidatus Eremiobacteraeota bacterium]|nr:hypothetical protein [Candidatus Eremiobacteraeota bacterium]MBV9056236.1 hypothetical protein [Candidatus Eremiobacteraeota bacterium]MBV9699087.1 hypothetical protein [Candidatus Eremiobacteraeota bacterium]
MKARKIKRGEDESSFEREIVAAMKPEDRMAMSWEIMANMLLMKGIDAASLRLDRSTARVQRGRR